MNACLPSDCYMTGNINRDNIVTLHYRLNNRDRNPKRRAGDGYLVIAVAASYRLYGSSYLAGTEPFAIMVFYPPLVYVRNNCRRVVYPRSMGE